MEVIIVDLVDDGARGDDRMNRPPVCRLHRPAVESVGQARAEGVRQARGAIVAFLEDHSYADRSWAEEVIAAFERPVEVVNYAMTPANPDSLLARMFLLIEYGRWMDPAIEGPLPISACQNVAYRREALEPFWNRLDRELDAEFLMCWKMQAAGATIWLAARAKLAHESWVQIRKGVGANGTLRHLFGAERARQGNWNLATRCAWAAGMPLVPPLQIARVARSLVGRPTLWPLFWAALPLMGLVYTVGSFSEAAGYLFGEGDSRARFRELETSTERQV